jgi:hypothetical protein
MLVLEVSQNSNRKKQRSKQYHEMQDLMAAAKNIERSSAVSFRELAHIIR